ncbi:hypothetical protein [Sneathiella sp.]|uniref:hypothetical protein n=1 Tax=Sneathiella sp. TaxID=1964365 RepID=UPI0035632A18
MPERKNTPELVAEPARQATSLFEAIAYQVWQTVLAWINLSENAILVVEGAEDFDTLNGNSANVNQVKNLASPISLRSDCVCDSLRNFWIVRSRNPERSITFCLITTASFCVEAGEPFGASNPGLGVWNDESRRNSVLHSEPIKRFILSDASVLRRLAKPLPQGVRDLSDHLRQLSPEQFRSEFICAIQWLQQQPDVEVIRDMVQAALHAYGETQHLASSDSDRALTRLFEHIAHVAFRDRRALTREDFRILFEDSTRISLPISQFNQMQAALAFPQSPSSLAANVNFSATEQSIPDLPTPCAPRTETVDILVESLRGHNFVAVQGSTGKGKSTIAKLAARKHGGNWIWISFAGRDSRRIIDELSRLAVNVSSQAKAVSLLLDDFNPKGADMPLSLQKLAVATRLTLAAGGRIIVTTQVMLGEVFLRQSNLSPQVLKTVPTFEEDEVRELCIQASCPNDSRLAARVSLISVQTGRHPQLVHARIKVASRHGWPAFGVSDVLETPQDITETRRLTRQLLEVLDDGEVELLFRLSIASEPFRRDQAVAVAEIDPAISRAGDRFDGLVGPWIESAGGKYFRLSLLLNRAADDNWSPEKVRLTRIEYAKAIHRTGNRTLIEAGEILFQSVLTKEAGLAAPVLAALMSAPLKARNRIAQELRWLLVLPDAKSVFPNAPFVSQLFSTVRFRLAAATQHSSALKLAEEVFKNAQISVSPKVDKFIIVSAAGDVILAIKVLVAPRLLLDCWLTVKSLGSGDKQLTKIFQSIEKKHPRVGGRFFPEQSYDNLLFAFVLSRRGDSDYLRRFIVAVDSLTPDQRKDIMAAINANLFRLYGFIDDVWTQELVKNPPDWDQAITVLSEARDSGERWCLPELSMIAARGIAAVYDEYLHKKDEALDVLSDVANKTGDGLFVRYQRGMVRFLHQEYDLAYREWRSTFEEWPQDSEEAALYAFHAFSNCGAAAGYLERWNDAQFAFKRGRELAQKLNRRLDALKFGIDSAYVRWRGGDRQGGLAELAGCYREMERIGRSNKSLEFHTTWKVMEHVGSWFKSDAGAPGDSEVVELRPGFCSEAKDWEKHELLKNTPRAPVLLAWICLAEAELYAHLGRAAFQTIVGRNDLKEFPKIRPILDLLRAQRAIADLDLVNVPIFAESSYLGFSRIDARNLTPESILQKAEPIEKNQARPEGVASYVEEALLCALLIASAEDIPWDHVSKGWRKTASRMRYPDVLLNAVGTIEMVCDEAPMNIYSKFAKSGVPRFTQIIAGLQLVVHPNTTPALCYVGLSALVTDAGFRINLMLSHDALAKLARKTWLLRISNPFELCSPRLTLAAIKAACESQLVGLALAANILLAAGDAVNVRKAGNTMAELRKMAVNL